MAKEVKPYRHYAERSLKELGVVHKQYEFMLKHVKQAYLEMRVKNYGYESRRGYVRRSIVEAKKNRVYFDALAKYLLDWNFNFGGKTRIEKLANVPYRYFNKIILYHYPNRVPHPSQIMPESCIDKWEGYWQREEVRHIHVDKQHTISKSKKFTPEEKASKEKYGYKNIVMVEQRLMHPEQYKITKKKFGRLKVLYKAWQKDLEEESVVEKEEALEKAFRRQVRFENQYSPELFKLFVTVRNEYERGLTCFDKIVQQFGDRVTVIVLGRWIRWRFNIDRFKSWAPNKEALKRIYGEYTHSWGEGRWELLPRPIRRKVAKQRKQLKFNFK